MIANQLKGNIILGWVLCIIMNEIKQTNKQNKARHIQIEQRSIVRFSPQTMQWYH